MAAISGRPDGRLAKFIYDGGLNGVIDYRLSAYPMDSKEEAAKVFSKVVNGSYRGLEKLVKSQVVKGTVTGSTSNAFIQLNDDEKPKELAVGSVVWVKANGVNDYNKRTVTSITTTSIGLNEDTSKDALPTMVFELTLNLSVSGEFNTQMVIGDPANILQTDALKDGWLGTWCPDLRTGTQMFALTRKKLGTDNPPSLYSDDFGVTWVSNVAGIDTVTNAWNHNQQPTRVSIVNYKAFAKQTKPSTNKPVLNGSEGLGNVGMHSDYRPEVGSLFSESLIGKVLRNTYGRKYVTGTLVDYDFWSDGNLQNASGYEPSHSPVILTAPNNDSPAVKALWYMTSDNGQVGLNFAYNELVWGNGAVIPNIDMMSQPIGIDRGELFYMTSPEMNGWFVRVTSASGTNTFQSYFDNGTYWCEANGDVYSSDVLVFKKVNKNNRWGDDSKIHIIDDQGTYNNLNGDTCLYGTNELAIPLGWTSNHARFGEQVEGVDL